MTPSEMKYVCLAVDISDQLSDSAERNPSSFGQIPSWFLYWLDKLHQWNFWPCISGKTQML